MRRHASGESKSRSFRESLIGYNELRRNRERREGAMDGIRAARAAWITVLICTTLAAAAAGGVPGTVVAEFSTELKTPTGLAWDGSRLWVADLESATLNAVDPSTGRIERTLEAPGYQPLGLAWDGKALWVVDGAEKTAYAIEIGRASCRERV